MKAKFTISITISEERDPDIFDWVRKQPGSMQNIIRDLLRREAARGQHPAQAEPARHPAQEQHVSGQAQGQRVPVTSFGVPSPDKPAAGGMVSNMLDNG